MGTIFPYAPHVFVFVTRKSMKFRGVLLLVMVLTCAPTGAREQEKIFYLRESLVKFKLFKITFSVY